MGTRLIVGADAGTHEASTRPALEVLSLTKRFGATTALDAVTLSIAPGEIHALLGHNGSGKSTLVKVLAGYHEPDEGEVRVDGEPVAYPVTQLEMIRRGVAFLHQDIGLVPTASVLDNVRIGRFRTGLGGRIRWRHERDALAGRLREFGLDVDPTDPVSILSPAQRTVVGLIRALQDLESRDGGLLVLDEATASLPVREVDELLTAVRSITARGISVLLVTHHLSEPIALADRVSVLRDGRLVETTSIAEQTEASLARMVIGADRPVLARRTSSAGTDVTLRVTGLTAPSVKNVSFDVHVGEIVGLTGLSGSGHDAVPYLIYGRDRPSAGGARVGEVARRTGSPAASRQAGLALVSGDRATAGGVISATVAENVSAPVLKSLSGVAGWVHVRRERGVVTDVLRRFDVRPALPSASFGTLSGGNQQKALIGRWMVEPPAVLLLDEPTSGVDIGAVDSIVGALGQYAEAGGSVVVSSTQYEDLARIADRVLVFVDGRVERELLGEDITPHAMLAMSYGTEREADALFAGVGIEDEEKA